MAEFIPRTRTERTDMPKNQLSLVQVLGDNTIIPLVTSAQGEQEAATTVERFPDADYHFTYAAVELVELTEEQNGQVFG